VTAAFILVSCLILKGFSGYNFYESRIEHRKKFFKEMNIIFPDLSKKNKVSVDKPAECGHKKLLPA